MTTNNKQTITNENVNQGNNFLHVIFLTSHETSIVFNILSSKVNPNSQNRCFLHKRFLLSKYPSIFSCPNTLTITRDRIPHIIIFRGDPDHLLLYIHTGIHHFIFALNYLHFCYICIYLHTIHGELKVLLHLPLTLN